MTDRTKAMITAGWVDLEMRGRPNVRYMHKLLDAVEAGERFRPHDPQPDYLEVMAAYRATGRKPREPGEDDEERTA